MSKLFVSLDHDCIYEPIYTREELVAAVFEHYMILEDNDREEATRQKDLRLYYGEEFRPFEYEQWFQPPYGSVWWEQEHRDLR